ncbi:MAG TPA: DUF6600 domain-containing protein [Candidatus Binatia bacterium]|nr:DUF6600 domain-containing protein [Candidatus Binatia bacterium]
MRTRGRVWVALLAAILLPAAVRAQGEPPATDGAPSAEEQPAAPAPPPAAPGGEGAPAPEGAPPGTTPPRLSYAEGDVSFWRPGAEDWSPARVNTPLAPGDSLYTGPRADVEVQVGPRAFVRAAGDTEIGLEDNEPDFQQFKITSGEAALDLRRLARGQTVEVDTPQAAFTIDRSGYYRVNVGKDSTAFITRRGGAATVTPAGGESVDVQPSEEIVLTGADSPQVATYVAPDLDPWDRWNYERTDHLLDPMSARYVPQGVYGADDLDHYGNWRTVPDYGSVWVPDAVPAGWAPYSTGRWIWDPFYGWTWVDDAPWGWAPYHYGRWVFVGGFWGWAPGPVLVSPLYAPALVAWFGVPGLAVGVSVGPALGWCALGWGEPLVPWWGRPGFVGVPWWGGWGGPRVVNNVVIERNTVINANNITIYRNAGVRHAIVAVPRGQFGRGTARHVQLTRAQAQQVRPLGGRIDARPVPASLVPGRGRARRPPDAVRARPVVATRAPKVAAPVTQPGGKALGGAAPAPHLVSAPARLRAGENARRPPLGPDHGAPVRPRPPPPPRFEPAGRARPRGGQPAGRAAQPRGEPGAPRGGGRPPAPAPHERAPAAPRARRPAPEFAAPPVPRRQRELPGEPANRLRPEFAPSAPRLRGPAPVPRMPAPAPRGGHERGGRRPQR